MSINPNSADKQTNRKQMDVCLPESDHGADMLVCCAWCSRYMFTKHQGCEGRAQAIMIPAPMLQSLSIQRWLTLRGLRQPQKCSYTGMASLLPTAHLWADPSWLLWCAGKPTHCSNTPSITSQLGHSQAWCSHLSGWANKHLFFVSGELLMTAHDRE